MSIYRWAKLDDQSGPDRIIELNHETYKGNAPSPVRRSPRHGQRFHEQGHPRGCGTNETRQRFLAEIGNHRLRFAFADLPDPPQSECYGRAHRTEPTWQMRYRSIFQSVNEPGNEL